MTITPTTPDCAATAADRRLDGGGCDALHCIGDAITPQCHAVGHWA